MIHFTKNTGQWRDEIAYVAKIEASSPLYKGAGVVQLVREGKGFTSFAYLADFEGTPADADEQEPDFCHAMASSFELVVVRGTAAAAVLNLVGDHA